jgi:LPXTG-motif cell wall-anchored protein
MTRHLHLRLLSLTLILVALLLAPSSRALAHADYVSSNPAADSQLSSAPATISVVFSEELTSDSTISVVDANGAVVDRGDGKVDTSDPERKTMVLSLKAGLGDGVYTVQWSAASADGHSEPGSFNFAVGVATRLPATGSGEQGSLLALLGLAIVALGSGLLLRRRSTL